MKPRTIAVIVEGQGEEVSLPNLVSRYLHSRGFYDIVPHPQSICTKTCTRIKASFDRKKQRGIEHFVGQAIANRADAILVLLDGDDECVERAAARRPSLGVELLERAQKEARGTPVSVVVANRSYEAWFIAAWPEIQAELEEHAGLELDDKTRRSAETQSGWGGTLEELLGRKYDKRDDHPALSRHLPFTGDVLRYAPSYYKLLHELDRLVRMIQKREAA